MKKEILQVYRRNIHQQTHFIKKLKKEKNRISAGRLITVITGFTISWYLWPATLAFIIAVLSSSIILIILVFRDAEKSEKIKNSERLININEHEIAAMEYHLNTTRYDDGLSFSDADHAFASDLDLFGPSSLFQWLNRCHAGQSKKLLAGYLKNPIPSAAIREKQIAVKELSEKQDYCQRFQSAAMAEPVGFESENKLKHWMTTPANRYQNKIWRWLLNIYPIFPMAVLALYLTNDLSARIFIYCLIGFYLISYLLSRSIIPEFGLLSNMEAEMNTLQKQFKLLESENFNSEFLQSLQKKLTPSGYSTASAAFGDFNNMLKKIDWRSHMLLNPILQVFLFWDLRLIRSLNAWKLRNRQQANEWFTVIAEMEVCISLASLAYNEPDWCFPETNENYFHFYAEGIGHPLIPVESRVTNNYSMEGTGKIAVITGSNMAGKSTFLRSLGINAILAGIGAPVCAGKMRLGDLKLISSMRVSDNLAENSSTFYAELKKLQFIIESVNRKEPVFVLLDEVLRGTNSADRHKGTRALVRQLLQSGAVAVIATHDTDLAFSESEASESVTNYHFDADIAGDKLYFDYKIKKGICESQNATTLMKKIGIRFQY